MNGDLPFWYAIDVKLIIHVISLCTQSVSNLTEKSEVDQFWMGGLDHCYCTKEILVKEATL